MNTTILLSIIGVFTTIFSSQDFGAWQSDKRKKKFHKIIVLQMIN